MNMSNTRGHAYQTPPFFDDGSYQSIINHCIWICHIIIMMILRKYLSENCWQNDNSRCVSIDSIDLSRLRADKTNMEQFSTKYLCNITYQRSFTWWHHHQL